jgi:hypothetical protein
MDMKQDKVQLLLVYLPAWKLEFLLYYYKQVEFVVVVHMASTLEKNEEEVVEEPYMVQTWVVLLVVVAPSYIEVVPVKELNNLLVKPVVLVVMVHR